MSSSTAYEIYLEALDCTEEERPIFIDFACSGNLTLQREIYALLKEDAEKTAPITESAGVSAGNVHRQIA